MPFFGREDRTPTPRDSGTPTPRPSAPSSPSSPTSRGTLIAPGLVVHGQVTGSDRIQVDGTVDGEIRLDGAVVVGPEGRVIGRIEARNVTVHGHLQGDLAANERAEVTASGKVEGDIEAPRVVIAEGAYFKGNVKMGQPSGSAGRGPGGAEGGGSREGAS